MAANLITPFDEITGLPHAILPFDIVPKTGEDFDDFHHHHFPRKSPELLPQINRNPNVQPEDYCLEDIAAIALRVCRGQLLSRPLHNLGHKRLATVRLPTSVDEKYITVTKACAGIVSRWAIDLRRPDEDLLVYMDDFTFRKVADPKVLCGERAYFDRPANYRRRIIGSFLLKYALEQDLSHVLPAVINEFLDTKVQSRRTELGSLLIRDALEVSLAPVLPIHAQLKRQGMIQPGKSDMRTAIKKFIHPERLPSYYNDLSLKLRPTA